MKIGGIFNSFKKYRPIFYTIMGSFIIVAGWNWYHLNKHDHARFALVSLFMWAGLVFIWFIFKRVYRYLMKRFHRYPWWQSEFCGFLDSLYFTASLVFLSFFSKSELLTLGIVSAVFLLLFWQSEYFLKKHPESAHWARVNRMFFCLGLFIFTVTSLAQYWSYYYYILDPSALIFNIVFFLV